MVASVRPSAGSVERLLKTYVNTDGRESVYDTVLLPALYYAKQDRDRGLLSEDDAQFVRQATREILENLLRAQSAREIPRQSVLRATWGSIVLVSWRC
ncbi:MAG TPA: hypothetical protein VMS64_31015 [Candidatus Methylomirabilis sp.]|nr:hypothetical protein [Candidatus Methylomirabilis sp.]